MKKGINSPNVIKDTTCTDRKEGDVIEHPYKSIEKSGKTTIIAGKLSYKHVIQVLRNFRRRVTL